jgi:hypothetical protein
LNFIDIGALNAFFLSKEFTDAFNGPERHLTTHEWLTKHIRFIGVQKGQAPAGVASMDTDIYQLSQIAKRAMAPNVWVASARDCNGEEATNLKSLDNVWFIARERQMQVANPIYEAGFNVDHSFAQPEPEPAAGLRRKRNQIDEPFDLSGVKKKTIRYIQIDPFASSDRTGPPLCLSTGEHDDGTKWIGKRFKIGVVIDTRGNTSQGMSATNMMYAREAVYARRRDEAHRTANLRLPQLEIMLRHN